MTAPLPAEDDLADIRTRDAFWTADYAHMHRSDGYGQAAADRRKLLGEIERLRTDAARYHWLRSEHPNVHAFWQRAAREKSLTLEVMDRVIDTLRPDDDVAQDPLTKNALTGVTRQVTTKGE